MAHKISEQEFIHQLAMIPFKVLLATRPHNLLQSFTEKCQLAEFDLLLNHRLGTDFAANKRQHLQESYAAFNRYKNTITAKHKTGKLDEEKLRLQSQFALDKLLAEYGKILSPKEQQEFLGVSYATKVFSGNRSL